MAGTARSGIGQIIVENPKGGGLDVFGADGLNGIQQDTRRLYVKRSWSPATKRSMSFSVFLLALDW
jgi:hypothetical protein